MICQYPRKGHFNWKLKKKHKKGLNIWSSRDEQRFSLDEGDCKKKLKIEKLPESFCPLSSQDKIHDTKVEKGRSIRKEFLKIDTS